MKKLSALLFCCLLIISVTPNDATLDSSNDTTSTSTTTTSTSTTSTTSTTPPTTTTTASTTSTPTTVAPITTTTPAPPPEPSTGKWIVNGTNQTCIIAKMAMQLTVLQNTQEKIIVDLPENANATGTCNAADQSIVLLWEDVELKKHNISKNDTITLRFMKRENTYVLSGLEAEVYLLGNSSVVLSNNTSHFNTSVGNSYRCLRLQTFHLNGTGTMKDYSGVLKVSNLQLQAFKSEKTDNFGLAEDCAFDTSDVVPIAVGCVLAGLVVIVLVAYLVSRRRSQARGYLSM